MLLSYVKTRTMKNNSKCSHLVESIHKRSHIIRTLSYPYIDDRSIIKRGLGLGGRVVLRLKFLQISLKISSLSLEMCHVVKNNSECCLLALASRLPQQLNRLILISHPAALLPPAACCVTAHRALQTLCCPCSPRALPASWTGLYGEVASPLQHNLYLYLLCNSKKKYTFSHRIKSFAYLLT